MSLFFLYLVAYLWTCLINCLIISVFQPITKKIVYRSICWPLVGIKTIINWWRNLPDK